jgi:hypothetical protein
MSAQKEAALIAAQMTDARDLSKAGAQLRFGGGGGGVKMSMAHAENMRVKGGNYAAALEAPGDDSGFVLPSGGGGLRVISDCHFRKTATEYDSKPGIKWLSCTEK